MLRRSWSRWKQVNSIAICWLHAGYLQRIAIRYYNFKLDCSRSPRPHGQTPSVYWNTVESASRHADAGNNVQTAIVWSLNRRLISTCTHRVNSYWRTQINSFHPNKSGSEVIIGDKFPRYFQWKHMNSDQTFIGDYCTLFFSIKTIQKFRNHSVPNSRSGSPEPIAMIMLLILTTGQETTDVWVHNATPPCF